MDPQQLARCCIERHHGAASPSRRVQDPVRFKRSRFEHVFGTRAQVVRLEGPGDFQAIEIRSVDLINRGITRMSEIPTVGSPLAVSRARLREYREIDQQMSVAAMVRIGTLYPW